MFFYFQEIVGVILGVDKNVGGGIIPKNVKGEFFMNDKAIELEADIYKVRKALERLKNIGLDVEKYEKLTEKIIAECNLETSYTTDNIFQNAFIETAYLSAIQNWMEFI